MMFTSEVNKSNKLADGCSKKNSHRPVNNPEAFKKGVSQFKIQPYTEQGTSITQSGDNIPINDEDVLEKEADHMGKVAAQNSSSSAHGGGTPVHGTVKTVIQRKEKKENIQGEIGLTNGKVTRAGAGVQVNGETTDGHKVREIDYPTKQAYQQSEAQIKDLETHASTHAFFDFVAHFLAYQEPGYPPPPPIIKIIMAAGYNPKSIIIKRGILGFQYVYLTSKGNGKNDIVGFRGTNPGLRPSDIATIYADLDPTSVGVQQYIDNESIIDELFKKSPGKLDITGHSLGGAVAQIVTANHASQVGNLYTFQSPGINFGSVKKYNNTKPKDRPNVYHHVAVGDMVDKAGEENIPGNVYVHDFGISWIKTQELLSTCGNDLLKMGKSIAGIAMNGSAIQKDMMRGAFEITIPLIGARLAMGQLKGIQRSITSMKNDALTAIDEGKALVTLLKKVGEAVGKAHTQYMFSSVNFEKSRKGIIDNKFYTNKDKSQGGQKDKVNEPSVVSAHQSYPFQDERKSAEIVRAEIGIGTYVHLNPFTAVLLCTVIEKTIQGLQKLYDGLVVLGNLIAMASSNAWRTIVGLPGQIADSMREFSINLQNAIYDLNHFKLY